MRTPNNLCTRYLSKVAVLSLLLLLCPAVAVWSQVAPPKATTTEVPPELPKDPLGRDTPRKTVLGFLSAARKGNAEVAALYLNTTLRGEASATLAHQLAIVLDRLLPARINEISDKPEGSIPNPLKPDEDFIGTMSTANGDLDVKIERIDRGSNGKVWLISKQTLAYIPSVYQELNTPAVERFLPDFMVTTRVAGIPIFEWLAILVGMPLLYWLTGLVGRVIELGIVAWRRRKEPNAEPRKNRLLPSPVRLLLLALIIHWLLSKISLPLLARQFWATVALMIVIAANTWLLILLNGWFERYMILRGRGWAGSASVLRLTRRLIDTVLLFAGLLITLRYFDVNVTAALAGLGVGGIAVALAAQKTLENVIAGISLIADRAVNVGDFVNVGDIQGTVEEVGLRSTRIRTLDRTIVCLPNGQIAAMMLETISARDKFWFHPMVSLRYETTPAQLRSVVAGIRELLSKQANVDPRSIRVRFIRFGTFSLDVESFAYVFARDVGAFLEIQETFLLEIMTIIQKAGAEIALPSVTGNMSDKLLEQPIR